MLLEASTGPSIQPRKHFQSLLITALLVADHHAKLKPVAQDLESGLLGSQDHKVSQMVFT